MTPPGSSLSAVRPALQTPAELLAAGRPADAAEALAAVVAETPTYAAAHVLLGVALDAAGRPAEALAAWNRAAFLVPRSPLVRRERQRLLDAARAAGPPVQTGEPPARSAEPPARSAEPLVQGAEPPLQSEEPPTIETAPLDDFIFADPTPDVAGGPDGFGPAGPDADGLDPDGFDFSAFDLGEDDDWLAPPADDGAADDGPAGDGAAPDGAPAQPPPTPLADWGDRLGPDDARIVLPDDAPPGDAPPDATPPAAPDDAWAVFEDLPEEPGAAPLDAVPPPYSDRGTGEDAAVSISPPELTEPEPAEPEPAAPEPAASEQPRHAPAAEPAAAVSPSASVFSDAGTGSVADELDDLIASLETAPRIRPDPAYSGPALRVATADVDETASETLARIYAAQHQYARAARVYETLAAREPERADDLLGQAAEMRRRHS